MQLGSGLEPVGPGGCQRASRSKTCFAWRGLDILPCASPASRLKRSGGSERSFVGEINALLHGYLPGGTMARQVVWKEMKDHDYRQTSAV
jgi:hypothetical protein